MYNARVARAAAVYRSGSSTEAYRVPDPTTPAQTADRARLWREELAKSMARIRRRAAQSATIVPAAHAAPTVPNAAPAPLRPTPGLLLVGAR